MCLTAQSFCSTVCAACSEQPGRGPAERKSHMALIIWKKGCWASFWRDLIPVASGSSYECLIRIRYDPLGAVETVEWKVIKFLIQSADQSADSELWVWAVGTQDKFGLEPNFQNSGNKWVMGREVQWYFDLPFILMVWSNCNSFRKALLAPMYPSWFLSFSLTLPTWSKQKRWNSTFSIKHDKLES